MAAFGQTFDPSAVPPAQPREILPPGKYLVHIVESEMKATKDGGGQYLQIVFAVLDGQYANKKVYDRLNLINANATAVEIANRALADICLATGTGPVSDSEQLHWKPLTITVKVDPTKGGYGPSNSISAYAPAGAAVAQATQQQQQPPAGPPTGQFQPQPAQPQRPPARPAGGVPPWKRAA
jgi:hypothetical protein